MRFCVYSCVLVLDCAMGVVCCWFGYWLLYFIHCLACSLRLDMFVGCCCWVVLMFWFRDFVYAFTLLYVGFRLLLFA